MVDFTIPDLTAIGGALADTTLFEVHRSGQASSEKAAGTDLKSYLRALGHPGYIAGWWYPPPGAEWNNAAAVVGQNLVKLAPLLVPQRITIDSIGVHVSTTTNPANAQFAIYAAGVNNRPTGTPLGKTADVLANTTNAQISGPLDASVTIEPGQLYWLATIVDNATTQFYGVAASGGSTAWMIGQSTLANLFSFFVFTGYSFAQTYGTWPDLTGASFSVLRQNNTPYFAFKVASIP